MDKLDKLMVVDDLIQQLEGELSEIKLLSKFLNSKNDRDNLMTECVDILDKVVKNAKNAKTMKDKKKYIKVSKLLDDYESGEYNVVQRPY